MSQQFIKIERTIEGVQLEMGLTAVFECQAYATVNTYSEDRSTGTPAGFEYDFTGDVFITDITVYDAHDELVNIDSDEFPERYRLAATVKFRSAVNWGSYDESVEEEIAEELANREESALEDDADRRMDEIRAGL